MKCELYCKQEKEELFEVEDLDEKYLACEYCLNKLLERFPAAKKLLIVKKYDVNNCKNI